MKYGIEQHITGVYMITNMKNNKRYVGASLNVSARFSNHMNRDSRRYDSEFYRDIRNGKFKDFKFEVLEECSADELIKREQYYYDLLKPEYNRYRPCENMFLVPEIRNLGIKNSNTPELVAKRKKKYNTLKYKKMFREMHTERMRPVRMSNGFKFMSIRSCARWLDKNTNYKSKNKASKVKAVCDGERNSAFGYKYEYINEGVETIPKGSTSVIDTQTEAVAKMI